MEIKLIQADCETKLTVMEGQSILDALRGRGLGFPAPCGGKGRCGKCRMLLRRGESFETCLACQTPVAEGMEVIATPAWTMAVQETGLPATLPPDERKNGSYGAAVDVGTTTLVCHLHDLHTGRRLATASCENPQTMFGADVASRISASMEGRLAAMHDSLVCMIDSLLELCCNEANIAHEQVGEMVLVGNTVMEHIAAGLPPDSIGTAPFTPESFFGEVYDLRALNLPKTYFAPAVAGYVGGDISAGILAAGFFDSEKPQMLIDVGTNGEIVLGCKDRMVCCATASGSAFEGAGIELGMPAAPGAISHVSFVDGHLLLDTIGGEAPCGICGSGLIDAIAVMLDIGVVDETGLLLDACDASPVWTSSIGEKAGIGVFYLTDDRRVYITQKDIRNIQLAKAAICAGIYVLAAEYCIELDSIGVLAVAGGFGTSLDLDNSARIGLFPQELLACTHAVGNAAGEGASALLISSAARAEVARIANAMEYVELSGNEAFTSKFIACMGLGEMR